MERRFRSRPTSILQYLLTLLVVFISEQAFFGASFTFITTPVVSRRSYYYYLSPTAGGRRRAACTTASSKIATSSTVLTIKKEGKDDLAKRQQDSANLDRRVRYALKKEKMSDQNPEPTGDLARALEADTNALLAPTTPVENQPPLLVFNGNDEYVATATMFMDRKLRYDLAREKMALEREKMAQESERTNRAFLELLGRAMEAQWSTTTATTPHRGICAVPSPNPGGTAANTAKPVSIGVVGCGTIASAIVTGLAKAQQQQQAGAGGTTSSTMTMISSISLSKRSEAKSSALQTEFPDLVTVYESNQDILDRADIVFLCVLNNQTATVLEPLVFDDQRHTLVSLVATSKLDNLRDLSKLSPDRVFKMICLPSVAKQEGCALIVPKTSQTEHDTNPNIQVILSMLQVLGGYVQCDNEEIMNVMITPTCLMGPFYAILRQNQEWLVQKGVPAQDATYFVGRQYWSMMQDAERGCHDDPNRFDELVREQTPGGLNEQALSNLRELGIYSAYDQAMEAVLSRLRGDSDGSLPHHKNKGENSDS